MDFLDAPRLPFYFSADHEQFRASLRDFVAREITPNVHEWDEAETFPRSLYERAAEMGIQGLGYPEEYGGTPADVFYQLVVAEEFARCGGGSPAQPSIFTLNSPFSSVTFPSRKYPLPESILVRSAETVIQSVLGATSA